MDPELGMRLAGAIPRARTNRKQAPGGPGRSARDGFTLLEIVVVAGLLAFLALGVGLVLRPSETVAGSVGGELVAAYLERARTAAVLHGVPVRVLLRDEPSAVADHRRQWGAVRRVRDRAGHWQALDRGLHLPVGILCDELGSAPAAAAPGRMLLEYPRAEPVPSGSGPSWRYIEIGPDGCLSRPLTVGLARADPKARANPRPAAPVPLLRLGVRRCAGVVPLGLPEGRE